MAGGQTPTLLTVHQAAERLTVSASTVRQLCDERKIIAIRPSGRPTGARRIVAESVERYLAGMISEAEGKSRQMKRHVEPEVDLVELCNSLIKATS